jgi:hypothetical protein
MDKSGINAALQKASVINPSLPQAQAPVSNKAVDAFVNRYGGGQWRPSEQARKSIEKALPRIDDRTNAGSESAVNVPSKAEAEQSFNSLKQMLSQDYNGPTSINYEWDPQNRTTLGNLANDGTVADVIAKDQIKSGSYGRGLRNLDTALLSLDKGVDRIQGELGEKQRQHNERVGAEASEFASKAQSYKDAAASARSDTKAKLEEIQSGMLSDVKSRAERANTDESARRKEFMDAYDKWYMDPLATQMRAGGRQQEAGTATSRAPMFNYQYEMGDTATPESAMNSSEASQFANLASLLGTEAVLRPDLTPKKTGNWKSSKDGWRDAEGRTLDPFKVAMELGYADNMDDAVKYVTEMRKQRGVK